MSGTEFYVGVGREGVFYTLWAYKFVSEGLGLKADVFIKNLSIDKDKAVFEAQEYAKKHGGSFMGVEGETFGKRVDLGFFGVHFTRKSVRKGDLRETYFYGQATPDFWVEWKKDKDVLKSKGFSVSKYDVSGGGQPGGVWYVFFRPKSEEVSL